MAVVADEVIVNFIANIDDYSKKIKSVIGLHNELLSSTSLITAGQQRYEAEHASSGIKVANDEEATASKVVRTRQARAAAVKATDQAEVASAKKSATARVETEEQAQARISAAVDRGLAVRASSVRAAGQRERSVPGSRASAAASSAVMRGTVVPGAAPEVAAEKEVNAELVERARLQAGLNVAKGQERRIAQEELADIRTYNQLLKAGLTEEAAAVELDGIRVARARELARQQAVSSRSGALKDASRFAEAAGIGRTGGGFAAVGGLVAATVVGGVVAAAKEGLDYANDLKTTSEQLGITTKDLQVYQTAAERAGVSTEQLRTAFGQLASNLGRAQEGAEEQKKLFGPNGLNINIGNAEKGYKSLSDVLPTVVERLSSIKDPARRAAIETALFGEQGRKLDGLLSGGTAGISALREELERTGAILSGEDIAKAAKVQRDLKLLSDQLERQLASTVANNAQAIEALATSLLRGATSLLKFIDAFQRFRAQTQINSGVPDLQAQGRSALNNTADGRQQAFANNSAGLRALRQGAKSNDEFIQVGNGLGANLVGFGAGYIANTPEARMAARKTLLAQRRDTLAAGSAANALDAGSSATAQDGKVGNLNIFAPKGPKGKSAETLAREADAREKRYEDELAQLRDAYLTSQRELTVGTEAQLKIDRDKIDVDAARKASDIQRQANEKQIDQARVAELQAANERARLEAQAVLTLRSRIAAEEAFNVARNSIYDKQLQETQAETAFATTAAERRRLALAEVRTRFEKQRDDLTATRDSINPAVTDAQRAQAQTDLDDLPFQQKLAQRSARQDTRGAGETYRDSLRFNNDDKKEFIGAEEVKALSLFNEGLDSSISKALHLHGVFGTILADLIDMSVKQGLIKPLANGLFGDGAAGSGSGLGGLFSSLLGKLGVGGRGTAASGGTFFGGLSSGSGIGDISGGGVFGARAAGGSVVPGANYLVGERGPEIVQFGGAGRVYPNGQLPPVAAPSQAGGGQITVHVQANDYFDARVAHVSGPIAQNTSVRVVRAAAPGIAQAGAAGSPAVIRRTQTLGS